MENKKTHDKLLLIIFIGLLGAYALGVTISLFTNLIGTIFNNYSIKYFLSINYLYFVLEASALVLMFLYMLKFKKANKCKIFIPISLFIFAVDFFVRFVTMVSSLVKYGWLYDGLYAVYLGFCAFLLFLIFNVFAFAGVFGFIKKENNLFKYIALLSGAGYFAISMLYNLTSIIGGGFSAYNFFIYCPIKIVMFLAIALLIKEDKQNENS